MSLYLITMSLLTEKIVIFLPCFLSMNKKVFVGNYLLSILLSKLKF